MPKQHVVQPGECLSSIAYENGFPVDTIWNDPANATLRETRTSPQVLLPGDVVTIPDRQVKEVAVATGRIHRFRRRDVPEMLRLELLDEGKPRAGVSYVLVIDGRKLEGTTSDEGKIEHPIPPNAREGLLTLEDSGEEIGLALGRLDPVAEEAGARARLENLGYLPAGESGAAPEALARALRRFQEDYELEINGNLDEPTRNKLLERYGC